MDRSRPRIISASRRTDIPAFYARWFMRRIQDGFCEWCNPFSGQRYRVSLRPEDCVAIVFWTRNPYPILPHLSFLQREGYRYYFHITITGYPRQFESHTPSVSHAISTFRCLADQLSPALCLWRYDPIIISNVTPAVYHLRQFEVLCRQLEGYTHRCYISFVDMYTKTRRRFQWLTLEQGIICEDFSGDDRRLLAAQMREIAASRGIALYACCEQDLLEAGLLPAQCIGADMLRILYPTGSPTFASAPTRPGCGCGASTDIGAYDTCPYGCIYCYASSSRESALRRFRSHDPDAASLIT